jgi:hypothetical protein
MTEHFVCPDHGAHVAADEDGCCTVCGADCVVEDCVCLASETARADKAEALVAQLTSETERLAGELMGERDNAMRFCLRTNKAEAHADGWLHACRVAEDRVDALVDRVRELEGAGRILMRAIERTPRLIVLGTVVDELDQAYAAGVAARLRG